MTDYLRLVRWKNLLIIGLTQLFFIYLTKAQFLEFKDIALIISTLLTAAGGYVINDFYDLEADKINKPNKVFIGKTIPKDHSRRFYFLLVILALWIGYYAFGPNTTYILYINVLLFLYSYRLKRWPLIGNIAVSICTAMVIYFLFITNPVIYLYLSNGVKKTVRTICQPILGENGKVLRLEGSTQDITELKKAKIKIEKTEEMYRLLAENSNDLICLQEPNSSFKYISPSVENLLGYNQSDFIGKEVFSIVHPEEIEELKETMYQKKDKITFTKPYDIRIRHKKGHYVWFEFLTSPVYKGDEISYFVTSARDISLWVSAKQEIDEYQSSLQKLTTEMTLLEENQKKEIASNIHDHLSQSLVISKMKINELKKKSELRWIDEDLKFIEKHISEVLENSRKITYELSPPVLYQLGIIDALNWLIENVETTHKINCKVNSNVSNINLNDVKSIIVYRCIQELIKNVIKYADASLLTLDLNSNENGINILLVDNGNGFDTSILNNYKSQTKSGFGLFAVKERIKNIQGEFTITSKINEGTSVNIFIPISK